MLCLSLELLRNAQEGQNSKKPKDVFNQCLACGCRELLVVDRDVLCLGCDWSSLRSDVEAGGFDGRQGHFSRIKSALVFIKNSILKPGAHAVPA